MLKFRVSIQVLRETWLFSAGIFEELPNNYGRNIEEMLKKC
jgi:hypothetical protein